MKTTETVGVILLTLGIVVALLTLFTIIHLTIENPTPKALVKEVSCYDRYYNEIQGLTCEKEYYEYDNDTWYVIGGFFLAMFLIVFGAGVYNSEERYTR